MEGEQLKIDAIDNEILKYIDVYFSKNEPTQQILAKNTEMSAATVWRRLSKLKKIGLIQEAEFYKIASHYRPKYKLTSNGVKTRELMDEIAKKIK